MRLSIVFAAMVVCASLLSSCTGCGAKQQSPEEIREKTAQATSEMKQDARAIAQGVREGWSRDKPLDLNSANKDQLMSLPGMGPTMADRVIAARPYDAASDLVSRHIISREEYDRIAERVTVKK